MQTFNSSSQQNDSFAKLVFELSKLPGIGEKTATRLAYFIIKQNNEYASSLASALLSAKQKTNLCSKCFTFTDSDPCRICSNPERDSTIICTVERPVDALTIEQTGLYRGFYHVLHGVLSPLDDVGPDNLKIRELIDRITNDPRQTREVILATNPSVEGEATALYLTKLLKPFGIKLTQLAHGLPVGGSIEYTDRQTIGKALANRVEMH